MTDAPQEKTESEARSKGPVRNFRRLAIDNRQTEWQTSSEKRKPTNAILGSRTRTVKGRSESIRAQPGRVRCEARSRQSAAS